MPIVGWPGRRVSGYRGAGAVGAEVGRVDAVAEGHAAALTPVRSGEKGCMKSVKFCERSVGGLRAGLRVLLPARGSPPDRQWARRRATDPDERVWRRRAWHPMLNVPPVVVGVAGSAPPDADVTDTGQEASPPPPTPPIAVRALSLNHGHDAVSKFVLLGGSLLSAKILLRWGLIWVMQNMPSWRLSCRYCRALHSRVRLRCPALYPISPAVP